MLKRPYHSHKVPLVPLVLLVLRIEQHQVLVGWLQLE
jgi:hypothetical protein